MKKRNLLKIFAALTMSAVAATACFSLVACGGGNDEDPNHEHDWATAWTSDENGHWHECLAEGHTGDNKDFGAHVDGDDDGICDICEYVIREIPVDAADTEVFKLNMADLSGTSVAAGAELKAGTGVYATSALTLEANSKSITYGGATVATGTRLKFTTTGKSDSNSLKFEIAEDNSVIVLYAYSGSDGSDRSLRLMDQDGTTIKDTSVGAGYGMDTVMFSVDHGTYYVGSAGSGVNVYFIAVWQGGNALPAENKTEVAKVEAGCETAGNEAYSVSEYGVYYNASNHVVHYSDVRIPAKGHSYSLDTTSIVAPSDTAEGSATVICANDSEHNVQVTLPLLTSDAYSSRVENAADSSKYDYTYNDAATGVSITFTAEKHDAAQINATTYVLYATAQGVAAVSAFDKDNSEWVDYGGILSNVTVAGSIFKPVDTATYPNGYPCVYDNGTSDTSDDLNIPVSIKFDSSGKYTFTLSGNARLTVYYTYKAGTTSQNTMNIGSSTLVLPLDTNKLLELQSATYETTLTAGDYTITRKSNEVEICFLVFTVVD